MTIKSTKINIKDIIKEDERERGKKIIKLLNLKVKKNSRISTSWGDKTPLGLFKILEKFISKDLKKL